MFCEREVKGCKFTMQNSVQEVLKPAVSSCLFGYFWDSGQKYLALASAKAPRKEPTMKRKILLCLILVIMLGIAGNMVMT